jgi:uncharacterized membrane protein
MVRQSKGASLVAPEAHFRWRGHEMTRLEALTDAVFAFAVTLLVVSLEVPRTFTELATAMKGFAAFGICFALLTWIWYHHYLFSRRYGLQTVYVITLNFVLIFVVLFYVYPLKFLFTMFVGGLTGGRTLPAGTLDSMISEAQVPALFLIYCVGYVAVFAILGLLYGHAWRLRAALALDDYEALATRHAMLSHLGYAAIGVLVALVAVLLPPRLAGAAGLVFFLNGAYGWVAGSMFSRRARRVLARSAPEHTVAEA